MHMIIQTIQDQGVPVHSTIAAAQHLGLNGIGQMTDSKYIGLIKEITDESIVLEDSDLYRMTYAYLCTEAISRSNNTDQLNAVELLTIAKEKAILLKKNHKWMFAKSDTPVKLDENGNAKPKKGAKKILAMEVYAEHIKDKVTVRKDAIAILVDKVGLTPAGASTYYANLKKHNGVI